MLRCEQTLGLMHEALSAPTSEARSDAMTQLQATTPVTQPLHYTSPDAERYLVAAAARLEAIQELMWDEAAAGWRDYNMETGELSSRQTAASFVPLWAGVLDQAPIETQQRVVEAARCSVLIGPGGVMTSSVHSGEQWDKVRRGECRLVGAHCAVFVVSQMDGRRCSTS